MIAYRLTTRGFDQARAELRLLHMPEGKRRNLLKKAARTVRKNSRQRIAAQTDLNGAKYPPRWKPRKDGRRMLAGLSKRLDIVRASGTEAVVGFRDGLSGHIAQQQQNGFTQTATPGNLPKASGNMASKRQAAKLVAAGFVWPGRGNRQRRKTVAWILSNLTTRQAGAILRDMTGKGGTKSWTTKLPPRSFLGATGPEQQALSQQILNDIMKG